MCKLNKYCPIHVVIIPKDQSPLTVQQSYLQQDPSSFANESSHNLETYVSTTKSQSENALGEAKSSVESNRKSVGRGSSGRAGPSKIGLVFFL